MIMHHTSLEDLIATIAGAPTQVITGSIDDGATWPITCTRIDETHVAVPVAGLLPLGSTDLLLRAEDGSENPVRFADTIEVY